MAEPSLAEAQARFWALATAPEGVACGLADAGQTPAELAEWVRGDARLGAVERLDVYANMYFFRLRDVLRSDFKKTLAAVGEEAFHNLAVDYLLACPPRHPSIRNVGDRLPAFLRLHDLGVARPWVADLAALEWARIDIFDAADSDLLTLDDVRALDAEALVRLPMRLVAAHRLLLLPSAADDAWRAADADLPSLTVEPSQVMLLVWRKDGAVYHRRPDAVETALLPLMADGAPFGAVCDRLAETHSADDAAQLAFTVLARLLNDAAIAR